MVIDWSILTIAIPAVLLTGLSKGGLAGGLAMLGTPLLALVMSPLEAAAVMLPMLMIMDGVSLFYYVRHANWKFIWTILPFGAAGIILGWLTAHRVHEEGIRLTLGVIAILFAINEVMRDIKTATARKPNQYKAGFWGTIAGFTSFVSHAGAPPFQAYAVPLRLPSLQYLGSSVVFFATINALKWPAYFSLGHLNANTLKLSALLLPVAVVGVMTGVWAVKRLRQEYFYRFTYLAMFVVGVKLIWDGLANL